MKEEKLIEQKLEEIQRSLNELNRSFNSFVESHMFTIGQRVVIDMALKCLEEEFGDDTKQIGDLPGIRQKLNLLTKRKIKITHKIGGV